MLDIAEQIFNMIVQCLMAQNLSVTDAFGGDDMIHVLEEFENQRNVKVMTIDDFVVRCQEIGVPELQKIQIDCIIHVLGKASLGNAIRLDELQILMSNFTQGLEHRMGNQDQTNQLREKEAQGEGDVKVKGKSKKKRQIIELLDENKELEECLVKVFIGKEGNK